jgi:hypothetical protein
MTSHWRLNWALRSCLRGDVVGNGAADALRIVVQIGVSEDRFTRAIGGGRHGAREIGPCDRPGLLRVSSRFVGEGAA